ncbi:MAG: hypothetical protein Ct9H300mP7_4690 [Verrucomicrobiota bacterium]|nr:MAG: hypothetical protein Ct9H300mP7_4690 [Verrucomicrobiota bacterium]
MKEERVAASKKLRGPKPLIKTQTPKIHRDIRSALYASKLFVRARFHAAPAAAEYGWKLNYGEIALMWRGG